MKSLAFFLLFFCGCAPAQSFIRQMDWENKIMNKYPPEVAARIIAPYHGGVLPEPQTSSAPISDVYFYQSFYYKNQPTLFQDYGRRGRK